MLLIKGVCLVHSALAEKLKSLFGTTGKSNAVVYDPSYATMDPVPHNSSANTPFTVHVPNTGNPHRYQGSEGRPAGVRKSWGVMVPGVLRVIWVIAMCPKGHIGHSHVS